MVTWIYAATGRILIFVQSCNTLQGLGKGVDMFAFEIGMGKLSVISYKSSPLQRLVFGV